MNAALVSGDHIFNVDEGVLSKEGMSECGTSFILYYLSSCLFEEFECLLNKISEGEFLALTVIDLIADVEVVILIQVEDREDLSVVRHLFSPTHQHLDFAFYPLSFSLRVLRRSCHR